MFSRNLIFTAGTLSVLAFASGCGNGRNRPAASAGYLAHFRNAVYLKASEYYGPLVVYPGETRVRASHAVLDAKGNPVVQDWIPWSGYWYPMNSTVLFDGDDSPLAKYDRIVREYDTDGRVKSSAAEEEEKFYRKHENSDPGDGRCDAWSMASIVYPEPRARYKEPRTGIRLEVGDQKGLLVKTMENVQKPMFGRPWGLDNDPQDIYPDQFHRVLQNELFIKKRPFVIDKDADAPVWNVPVFEARSVITRDDSRADTFHVQTILWIVDPEFDFDDDSERNYVGSNVVMLEPYTYDLHGNPTADGGLDVQDGEWTGKSTDSHPDYAVIIPNPIVRKSRNPSVLPDLVDAILNEKMYSL